MVDSMLGSFCLGLDVALVPLCGLGLHALDLGLLGRDILAKEVVLPMALAIEELWVAFEPVKEAIRVVDKLLLCLLLRLSHRLRVSLLKYQMSRVALRDDHQHPALARRLLPDLDGSSTNCGVEIRIVALAESV